jgi:hypothetical protein
MNFAKHCLPNCYVGSLLLIIIEYYKMRPTDTPPKGSIWKKWPAKMPCYFSFRYSLQAKVGYGKIVFEKVIDFCRMPDRQS